MLLSKTAVNAFILICTHFIGHESIRSTLHSYHSLAGAILHNERLNIFTSCRKLSSCCVADKVANPAIKELEAMLLDCAKLDREINYFVDVVQQVTAEVRSAWHHLITGPDVELSNWNYTGTRR